MSGELQTIPARHGVATFVPRGRTIKIINTYGKQVVSTWAFSLAAPPGDEEDGEQLETEEDIEQKAKELQMEIDQPDSQKKETNTKDAKKGETAESSEKERKDAGKDTKERTGTDKDQGQSEQPKEGDPSEQASSNNDAKKEPEKRTWSSYIPSIPYRSKGTSAKAEPATDPKSDKAENEETSKKWSSYLPTGKSFSSYVPNVSLPESKNVVSAFKASHHRDPNKSYAEQLYDFSRTPVGAASIAAATGSGTASSLYAAYNAYSKMNPNRADQPPMEFLSLPHTRAATHHLGLEVNDTLLTNLRQPIMTLIEDTTPGAHDTLTAACDAGQYAALGVDRPEEHGSCAENLVLALKELNEKAGLQGTKAVGCDITVYIAPTPLHLFMNAPIETGTSTENEGTGARGVTFKVAEPKGKKRSYVRFRAERDMVVVMSACPMDVGSQNGPRPMAANFMVEDVSEEELTASISSLKNHAAQKDTPKKAQITPKKDGGKQIPQKLERGQTPKGAPEKQKAEPKSSEAPAKAQSPKKPAEVVRRDSGAGDDLKEATKPKQTTSTKEEPPKTKKKPKKLERRSPSTAPPTNSAGS